MNKINRYEIFRRFSKHNANPTIELIYNSPFELFISVLLSARSTDINVNLTTKRLFLIANTPEKILNLGIDELKNIIKPVGLFNKKAKYILEACKIIMDEFQNLIPNNRLSLEKIPGVGRKTSNLILNIIFKKPTIAVDTHVFRVCNRTKIAIGKNVRIVEKKLLLLTPKKFKMYSHHWLVKHGKYVCTTYKPKCKSCLIQDLCMFKIIKHHI